MRKFIGLALLSALMACHNGEQSAAAAADTTIKAEDTAVANEVELADPRVDNIYKAYISLKNALVNANAAAAGQTAKELGLALKGFDGCENTALIADKIAGSEDLKLQRKEFTALSSDVIALFKHTDVKKGTIYVQHCPMANNGDGGDWLSSDKKIRNPYFGSQMMECGAELQQIKAKKKV